MVRLLLLISLLAVMIFGCRGGGKVQSAVANHRELSPYMNAIASSALETDLSKGTVSKEGMLTFGNAVQLQAAIEGPNIFGAMREMILSAKEEILVQFYVWDPSSAGHQMIMDAFRELYARQHPQKIQIKILISNLMFFQVPAAVKIGEEMKQFQNPMIESEVVIYSHLLFAALHAKSLVIDGNLGLVTGANIQKFHNPGEPWYDLGFIVSGDVAKGLREDFINGLIAARKLNAQDMSVFDKDDMLQQWRMRWAPPPSSMVMNRDMGPGWAHDVPILIISRRGQEIPNNDIKNPQNIGFIAAFENAQRIIKIQTPNLNDDHAKQAIIHAVRRGVKVEIILSKNFNFKEMMFPGMGGPNEFNVPELYEALSPQERALLDIRWYAFEPGITVVDGGQRRRSSHAKFASFDDQISIVGSSNMDTQSWNQSREVNLVIDSPVVTAAWNKSIFDSNFAKAVPACRLEGQLVCD